MTTEALDAIAPPVRRTRRPTWSIWLALTAVAAGLCLYRLGARSVWLDEAATLNIARTPQWSALLSDGGNMAVYYLFMKGWLAAGDSEWMIRLPSVVFSIVAAGLLFLLGRKLFDDRVAVVAATLLVVNSSFVRYSQEARSYAFQLMAVTAAWLVLSVALRRRQMRWFVAWGALSAIAVGSQLFTLLFVPAQLATALLVPQARALWRPLLAGLAAFAAGSALFVATALETGPVHIGWMRPLSVPAFRQILLFLSGNNFEPAPGTLAYSISLAVLAAYLAGWAAGLQTAVRALMHRARSEQAWAYGMVAAWLVIPLAAAIVVSAGLHSLVAPRYFIGLLPAGCLLLAVGVCRLTKPPLVVGAVGLLVVAGLWATARMYPTGDWGWRQAATYLASSTGPGDEVVVLPLHQRLPLDYYIQGTGDAPSYLSPRRAPWRPPSRTTFGVIEAFFRPSSPREAARLARNQQSLWVVSTDFVRWDRSGRVVEAWAAAGSFFRSLGPNYIVSSGRAFGRIGVLRVEAKSGRSRA